MENKLYSIFAQEYIQVYDEFKGLAGEMNEIVQNDDTVPSDLKQEYYIYRDKLIEMNEIAEQIYHKEPREVYKDGWDFWMKEDAELRQKRYGTSP